MKFDIIFIYLINRKLMKITFFFKYKIISLFAMTFFKDYQKFIFYLKITFFYYK